MIVIRIDQIDRIVLLVGTILKTLITVLLIETITEEEEIEILVLLMMVMMEIDVNTLLLAKDLDINSPLFSFPPLFLLLLFTFG